MKGYVKKKVFLNLTMDSSEATVFMKGGIQSMKVMLSELSLAEDEDCELEVSVQIAKDQQGRIDFTYGQGQQHRMECDESNS